MMPLSVPLAAIATVVLLPFSALGSPPSTQGTAKEQVEYRGAALDTGVLYAGFTVVGHTIAAGTLHPPARALRMTLVVKDGTHRPVSYDVMQRDASGAEHLLFANCGDSPQFVRIQFPGVPVLVRLYARPCSAGMFSVPTIGTIASTYR